MDDSIPNTADQLELQWTNKSRLIQRQNSVILNRESFSASEEEDEIDQKKYSEMIRRKVKTTAKLNNSKDLKQLRSSQDSKEQKFDATISSKTIRQLRDSYMLKTQQRKQRNALMIESLVNYRDTFKQGPVELELLFDDAGDYREQIWAENHPCLKYFNSWKYIPIMDPNNRYIMAWKIFLLIIVLFYFFEIPIYFAWGIVFWLVFFLIFLLIFFKSITTKQTIELIFGFTVFLLTIDILLELVTAYYNNGNLIRQRDRVMIHYLKNNFTFDMIALISFTVRGSVHSDQGRWVYFLFFFKIPWVWKVDDQFLEVLLLHKRMRTFYGIFKIILTMFFCFTFYGCFFFLLGLHCIELGYNSWVINQGNFGVILNLDVQQQLFFSFYFSLGTLSSTMGYGDITPLNPYECLYCLFGIMFGVMVFAININFIQNILEEHSQKQNRQFHAKTAINRFMKRKQVPPELQERVRQYLIEHWNTEAARDLQLENETILELAPELREELIHTAYGQFLCEVPLFTSFTHDFLKAVSMFIKEVQYSEGEVIFQDLNILKENDFSFFYIFLGSVYIHPKQAMNKDFKHEKQYLKKLEKTEYFGELGFITGQIRTASAKAASYSQLYQISREEFITALRRFPEEFEKFHSIKDQIVFGKSHDIILTECWTCGSKDHYATSCTTSHYQPELQMALMNLGFKNYDQPRVQFERGDRQQWKTLTKLKLLVKVSNNNKVKKAATKILQKNQFKAQTFAQVVQNQQMKKFVDKNDNVSSEQLQKEMRTIFGIYSLEELHKSSKDIDMPKSYKYYFPQYNFNNIWNASGQLVQNKNEKKKQI